MERSGFGGQILVVFEGGVFDELAVVYGIGFDINYLFLLCFYIILLIVLARVGAVPLIRVEVVSILEGTGIIEVIIHGDSFRIG